MLGITQRLEDTHNFRTTQDNREFALAPGTGQLPDHLGPMEHAVVEKLDSADGLVKIGAGNLLLIDLVKQVLTDLRFPYLFYIPVEKTAEAQQVVAIGLAGGWTVSAQLEFFLYRR